MINKNKGTVLRGLKWSLADQFGIYLLKLIFGILIARLLSPDDFGLVGIITIFIAIGSQLTDSGFQMALIQKKDSGEKEFNTVFVFNLIASVVVYCILFFASRPIADFYNLPDLVGIIRIASLNILIGALSGVQLVLLIKKLDFKTQAKINFISTLISGTVGFLFALSGFGFWSLVAQTLSGTAARSCMLWFKAQWIPSITFNTESFRSLFRFGSKILGQGLIDNFFTNLYNPLIGKFYPIDQLGFYSKAKSFTDLYTMQISLAVGRVAFPALSNKSNDIDFLKTNYRIVISVLTVFFFGSTLVLFPLIKPFIVLLLTNKWICLVPLMQLFIMEAFFYPLYRFNIVFLEAQGKSGITLLVDLSKKVIILITLFLTINKGLEMIIYGLLLSSCISLFITWFFLRGFFSLKEQLRLYSLNLVIAILIFVVTWLINQTGSVLAPFINSLIAFIVFFVLIRFPFTRAFNHTKDFIYQVKKSYE